MRGRLEKASLEQRDNADHQPVIIEAIADFDDVLHIFSSLTRISQIEATDRTVAFRTVDLLDVASDVVELFDAAAEERGIHHDLIGNVSAVVTADRDLLFASA